MLLYPKQLAAHLKSDSLQPVYLVSGDEPLQTQELLDALRARARTLGYAEREVAQVEPGFDWLAWRGASLTTGLFGQRRIVELRSNSTKFGVEGGKVLESYCRAVPPDTLLLLSLPRLDAEGTKTPWYKAVEAAGVVMRVWPLETQQLPQWLSGRLQARGVKLEPAALSLLATQVEGNLLAAAQAVERLALWSDGKTSLSAAVVAAHIADSAHFSVYDLADAVFAGETARALRVLQHLYAEGEAPVLILWAITRDLRLLAQAAFAVQCGKPANSVVASLKPNERYMMERRWDRLSAALPRWPLTTWQRLLAQCAYADRVNKGTVPGDAWLTLEVLCQQIATGQGY